MGRTKDCKTKKLCWRFVVSYPDRNITIIDKEYSTLSEISKETGLPYSKINDLKDGGRNKTKNTISFYPTLKLYKITNIGAIKDINTTESTESITED